MKQRRNVPKLTLAQAVDNLRFQGYQPLYEKGRLKDWRRVRKGDLHTAKVIVHPSGRVCITHGSTANGKAGRKRHSNQDNQAQSERETNTSQA